MNRQATDRRNPRRAMARAAVLALCLVAGCGGPAETGSETNAGRPPSLSPDLAAVVLPPNIAPVNLTVSEPGRRYRATLSGSAGTPLRADSQGPAIAWPGDGWRALLKANAGEALTLEVRVLADDGSTTVFSPVTFRVAQEPIDPFLVYRSIGPQYNFWHDVRVVQRDLTGFAERDVLRGTDFSDGCTNCHAFAGHSPSTMSIATRSKDYGSASLLVRDGKAERLNTKWGYTSWSPDGRFAAYSLNKVRQFFHLGGTHEVRDVLDLDSEIVVYDAEENRVFTAPALADPDRMESYPCWAPDGKSLFFVSAPIPWQDRVRMVPPEYRDVRYSLMRAAFNPDDGSFGPPETVLSAEDAGGSVLIPKVSPDGSRVLCCLSEYGCFPVYSPTSDLILVDAATGTFAAVEAWNSDQSESYHSWSSNGRWCVFSSKRDNGVFTRTYVGYFGEDGTASKPFIVPRQDPTFYDAHLKTMTVPELIREAIPVRPRALAGKARAKGGLAVELPVTMMSPKTKDPAAGLADLPWQPAPKQN